jgi:uncharacterized membrane protein
MSADPPGERIERNAAALERLVFFSDAVFVIAMTLLVLDIPRPDPGVNATAFLTHQNGKFIAFFISFWVIALFWFGHHRLFRYVRAYDQGLLLVNLVLLFTVAFLPYPSAILGDHGDEVGATVFYAASLAIAGFASAGLTWYTVRFRGFTGPLPATIGRYYVFRGLIVSIVFLVSIPVAVASPAAARFVWLACFPLQWAGRRYAERRSGMSVTP